LTNALLRVHQVFKKAKPSFVALLVFVLTKRLLWNMGLNNLQNLKAVEPSHCPVPTPGIGGQSIHDPKSQ
jgi:hypothetical protein